MKARTSDYLAAQIVLGVTERMTNKEIKQRFDEEWEKVAIKYKVDSSKGIMPGIDL